METIFPEESKATLNLVANLGLVYFLFIVGVEMNPRVVMKNARAAISISAGGICLCFALGAAVSYGLYTQFTDETGKFSSFLIFIGVTMSITVSFNFLY
jgi:Kef-type K+ transport system membrane component KefB